MEKRPALAQRLRDERLARGWMQKDLARRIAEVAAGLGITMPERESLIRSMKNWEAGTRRPRHPYPILIARALGMDVAELFGEPPAPQRAPADVLAAIMPEDDPPTSGAGRTGGRLGLGTVADLSARVHGLRLADDVLGGKDLIGTAFRELDSAVRLYRECAHTDRAGRELLAVIGEGAQIAGWIASDAGQHAQAAQSYRLGISAAREAGDQTLESNLIGCLAYQTANIGDTKRGVDLAMAAVDAAGPRSPARARALAWDRAAWAHARHGDARAAVRALGQAGEALASDREERNPSYLYWVDQSELQIMEARVYTELRRPLRAVPLLATVLARYDATHARELALYLSWLAVALADANELEEAARTATRMLDLSSGLASDRTAQRARIVLGRLQAYDNVPEVLDLLARTR